MRRPKKNLTAFAGMTLIGLLIAFAAFWLVILRTGIAADYFHIMAFCCILLGFLTVVLTAFLVFVRRCSIARIYPVLAICLGVLTYFVLSVYTKPDDTHHLASAYVLSNRMLQTVSDEGNIITTRRACDDLLEQFVDGDIGDRQMLFLSEDTYNMIGSWFAPTEDTELVAAKLTKYKGGSAFPYLMGAFGITAARLLGLNFGWAALFGSLLQMFFFVGTMTYAIRRTPIGKQMFFVFGLLPIVLQQTASFSYDCAVLSGCVLVTALSLRWACDREEREKRAEGHPAALRVKAVDALMFLLAALLLFTAKGGIYGPLIFLPLLLLFKRSWLKSARNRWILAGGILLIILGVLYYLFGMGGWSNIEYQLNYEYYNVFTGESGFSILYYLQHPGRFLWLFFHTLHVRGIIYLKELVGGFLGWYRNIVISWKVLICFYVLLFLALFRQKEDRAELPLRFRALFLFIAAAYDGLMMAIMEVRWSVDAWNEIDGVQGRYFLPTLPLALLAIGFWQRRERGRKEVLSEKIAGCFSRIVPLKQQVGELPPVPESIFPAGMVLLDVLVLCICVWMTTLG